MLWVAGESLCTGYWCRTDVNRLVFHGEWMRTGDTYVRGADGSWTCLGRADDVLKVGGIWVSPTEVETRILEHPAVAEAVVVGVPDEDGLDKPVAYVVAMPDAAIDEADDHRVLPGGARVVQAAPQGGHGDRAAQDRHREDPALPAARARGDAESSTTLDVQDIVVRRISRHDAGVVRRGPGHATGTGSSTSTGEIAYLRLDVAEDGGIVPGYELKMNSYDLGVDIELYDATQRLRFEHPGVRAVVRHQREGPQLLRGRQHPDARPVARTRGR